jgi:hypothetical protein
MRNPYPLRGTPEQPYAVSLALVRRVWAAVTLAPAAPIRQLARNAGTAYSTVQRALEILRAAGYIDYPDRASAARVIHVGLYPQGRIIP